MANTTTNTNVTYDSNGRWIEAFEDITLSGSNKATHAGAKEASKYFAVSTSTLRRYLADGKIFGYYSGGKAFYELSKRNKSIVSKLRAAPSKKNRKAVRIGASSKRSSAKTSNKRTGTSEVISLLKKIASALGI